MDPLANYQSPFESRYASQAMRFNFSERHRIGTWRKLWTILAETQRELGLAISEEQVAELRAAQDDIDFARARALEAELRHDVMAHVHAYGEACPRARGVIHLGATSCYVTDNTELIQMRDGLDILLGALAGVVRSLRDFALAHRALPVLAYTHFQPAQPTTLGKRACLWIHDLLIDLRDLLRLRAEMPFRGAKGTTGTQASFLSLFDGDHAKVKELDQRIAVKMGFRESLRITSQTYTRKFDARVVYGLAGLAQSAGKMGEDLRLLAHERELEEPIEAKQIGSSAMPYKRNPMRAERVCALARHLIALTIDPAFTAATQWLERSLDDSANRRIALAEAFLCADSIVRILASISSGLIVNHAVIAKNLEREIPFLVAEEILMEGVRAGGDRQVLHERIRVHARAVMERLKAGASDNDLLTRLQDDPAFAAIRTRLGLLANPVRLVGRAPEQVSEFIAAEVDPLLARLPRPTAADELAV